jgi:predicted Fe-Mo cluster-binding NifX family protein
MKIVITTTSPTLESEVDPRFGRGAFLLIVDPETLDWQAFPNPGVNAPGGAGIQAAQVAINQQAEAAISGDFGPNAFDALKAAGIPMYLFGPCRTVPEAIQHYQSGQLQALSAPAGIGRPGHGRAR